MTDAQIQGLKDRAGQSVYKRFVRRQSKEDDKGGFRGVCPIHRGQDATAFSVFKRSGEWKWHCHTECNDGGDVIKFVRRLEGMEFPQALSRLRELLDGAPHIVEPETSAPETDEPDAPEPWPSWLPWYPTDWQPITQVTRDVIAAKRKDYTASVEVMRSAGVVEANGKFVAFPCKVGDEVRNLKVLNFTKPKDDWQFPQYRPGPQPGTKISPDTSVPFNLNTVDACSPLFIVEGQWACFTMEEAGFPTAALTSAGQASFSKDVLERINMAPFIFFCPDNDFEGTGFETFKRLAPLLPVDRTGLLSYADWKVKDACELRKQFDSREEFKAEIERACEVTQDAVEYENEHPEYLDYQDRLAKWDGQGPTPELQLAPEGYPKDLDDSVIFGPTREFVDLCLPCVEMDRNGLVAFFLCVIGSILGRRIYNEAGSVQHFPATYHGVIAGTSEGKGPAQAAALRLGQWVDENWRNEAVFSGAAASGQGLVRVLSEAHSKSEGRVYKELGELAALLAVAKRETDPMSANLRDAWDFKRLNKPASKAENSVIADNYALSCSAGITVRELRERVGTADWANGLAGRFIWTAAQARMWHKRPKPMASLQELGMHVQRQLPDRNSNFRLDYTETGAHVWDSWVEELEAWVKAPNIRHTLLADACGKLRANALRVAMIFAALEGPTWNKTYGMDEHHVKAATAFINRSRDSLVWVFNHGQTKAESSENKQKFNELINRWTNQLPDEEFRKAFSHMTPEERNTLASSCYAKCKPAPLTGKPGRPGKIWTR